MPSTFEIITWLLRKAGTASLEQLKYCFTNPLDAYCDLCDWIKNNKLTCAMILGGIIVIAVPPAIGFSAIGPVAGSIAAGWQASLGSVAAGSLFAVMQSLTMTGILTAIGGGIIGAGMTWGLVTRDWKSMISKLIQSYMHDHQQVVHSTLATIRDMRGILFRIDSLARTMSEDEYTRILELIDEINRLFARIDEINRLFARIDEINRLFARIVEIKRVHTMMQNFESAITRDAPEDELAVLMEDLRGAWDAFCIQDAWAGTLRDEWVACLKLANTRCSELREAASAPGAGQDLRKLVRELERKASELLRMTL